MDNYNFLFITTAKLSILKEKKKLYIGIIYRNINKILHRNAYNARGQNPQLYARAHIWNTWMYSGNEIRVYSRAIRYRNSRICLANIQIFTIARIHAAHAWHVICNVNQPKRLYSPHRGFSDIQPSHIFWHLENDNCRFVNHCRRLLLT